MGIFSKKSLLLNGTTEYASGGNVLDKANTDDFSLVCWIKPSALAATTFVIGKRAYSAAPDEGYEIQLQSTGLIRFALEDGAGNQMNVEATTTTLALDSWYQIVATWEGSSGNAASNAKVYINAASQALTPIVDTLAGTISNAAPFTIGARNGTTAHFPGNLDDGAVYNKVLSGAEITAIYNVYNPADLRLLATSLNLEGYWTCGDGDTLVNLRDRQVVTPLLAAGSVKDRSVNSNDGTPTAMEDADFRAVILASETMPDLSGSGNAGTPTNMEDGDFTTDVPGLGNSWYSMTLDGVNEHVLIGDVAPYKFDVGSAFSISIWFKTSSSTSQVMVGKINFADAAAPGYSVEIASDGTVLFEFIDDLTVPQRVVVVEAGSVDRADGVWHHVCATKGTTEAGSDTLLYLDGVDVTSLSINTFVSGGGTSFDNTIPLQIGGANGQFTWNGQLDEASIHDKKLTLAEVQAIYNAGAPVDNRTLSTVGNLVGYWGCGDAGPGGSHRNVAHLDGVAEYIDFGDQTEFQFARTDPFSLGYWSKKPLGAGFEQAMTKLQLSGVRGYALHHANTVVGLDLINESATPLQATKRGDYPDDGSWHFVVCTWDGDVIGGAAGINVYVDGVLAPNQSILFDTLASLTIANTAPLRVGATGWASSFWTGAMCGAFVMDREMTAAEVLRAFNSGRPIDLTLDAVEPNLVGYWGMGEAANDLTVTGGSIVSDVAETFGQVQLAPTLTVRAGDDHGQVELSTGGAGGGPVETFVMRGRDDGRVPGSDYIVWVVTVTPDFAGAGFAGGDPTPIGSLIAGSVVVASQS